MATVLFTVRATIAADREDAFNHWYNTEHCPQVLEFPGTVSARRFKVLIGDDAFQYMAVYEFEDEAAFRRFQDSDHLKELIREYDAKFGEASHRERSAYLQVWP